MMYEDKKTWKQHYDEWVRMLPKIKEEMNVGNFKVLTVDEYRVHVFERLIKDYEAMNND